MPRKKKKDDTYEEPQNEKALEGDTSDAPEKDDKEVFRIKAVGIAAEQLETSMKFKQPRMAEVRTNEDIYLGKPKVALRNRFNVPFDSVVMQGAVDTVLARSDDRPKLAYEADAEENQRGAAKITAAFEKESSDSMGRWAQKDRLAKKMAYLSGRAIFEIYSESDPKYKNVLKVVDHYDFQCEPGGGNYLEDHLFAGTINNFFTKESLIKGAERGLYIKSEVEKLINNSDAQMRKEDMDEFRNRQQRFQALGLDLDQHNYAGTAVFNLVKWATTIEGERYYMLFDPRTKICVRLEKLTDVFKSGLYPWSSWATHDDSIFWSRSFADTIRPIAEVYRILVNQMLENIQKRNWNMRAYDPQVFPDPSKLLYTPDGLTKANLKPGMTSVQQGIFSFETPETTGVTLNAIEWLNSFLGEKTGITPGAQGASEDTKVGIYYGNIQQVAERFGLLNKSYTQCWIDLGLRYDWGLHEHCPEDMMVKLTGITGVGWEKIVKEDTEPDYTCRVVSTNAEAAENELKARRQSDALTKIQSNPLLMRNVGPRWLTENILRSGGFDDEQIRVAMNLEADGAQEVLLKAAESIRKIVDGQWPVQLIRSATTGFQQKIIDYATDNAESLTPRQYDHLMIYAKAHDQFVMENTVRKAMTSPILNPEGSASLAPGGSGMAPGGGIPSPMGETPMPGAGPGGAPLMPR